jgi:hypothetical protein
MGEVLAKKTNQLSTETLTWNDIEIEDDSCLVHVKFSKVSKKGGDYVQIFKVDGVKCCPVRALRLLKDLSGKIDKNSSPFKLSNGKFLTQSFILCKFETLGESLQKQRVHRKTNRPLL